MEKHLIVLDLDGTTLKDIKSIHRKNIEIIKKLKQEGHIVCISTGRPFRYSKKFYKKLGLDTVISNYNSGFIHHPIDKNFEELSIGVDKELIKEILNSEIKDYIKNYYIEYKDIVYIQKNSLFLRILLRFGGIKIKVGNVFKHLETDPLQFVFEFDKIHYDEVFKYLNSLNKKINYYRGDVRLLSKFIEIYNVNVNKAKSIEILSEHYNIPRNRVLAFGDGINDIEMIKNTGIGIAMKNAHPNLKEVADCITEYTNKQGGVGLFLKDYFNIG